jgi:AcrR family transcriptional regulator
METTPAEPKERILQAALELLDEGMEPEKITMRRIAQRAAVGVGLINYHFQTRENLLNSAVGIAMQREARQWSSPVQDPVTPLPPRDRLKALLLGASRILLRYPRMARIAVSYELNHGTLEPMQYMLPLLREMFGASKDEAALRLLALQILLPMQVLYLRAEDWRPFLGIQTINETNLEQMLDVMLDNLLPASK